MAYKGYRLPYTTLYQAYLDVCTAMVNMGWALHDQGLKAFGTLTSNGTNVSNGNTVTIDTKTYIFRTTLTPTEGEVKIGGSASATLDNLKAAINHTGTPDTDYSCAAAHPTCTAETKTDTTLKIQSIIYGAGGRYAFAENAVTLTVSVANLAGNTPSIYKSNGEAGNRPYGYMAIWPSGAQICFRPYLYWDAAAHTGTLSANYNANYNFVTYSNNFYVMGDKNLVYVSMVTIGGQGNSMLFGHFTPIQTQITNTSDAISTGSHVSIPVTSSTGFAAGMVIQIVGVTEGRDKLVVESIPDATHIVVVSLPRNYASGAFLGAPAMCFACPSTATKYNTFEVAAWGQVGLTDPTASDYLIPNIMMATPSIDPDALTLCYSMGAIFLTFNTTAYIATAPPFLGIYGPAAGDILGINADGSKSPSNSCTSAGNTTLVDSTKSWEVDALIGKYVIISDGTGVGQARKILDNDGTTLTVVLWTLNPDNTSTYRIVDEVWRVLELSIHLQSAGMVGKETEHSLT